MNIEEIKPGAGIELKAEIVRIMPIRKIWKCFECENQGAWIESSDFQKKCPICQANQSKEKKKGLWIQEVTTAIIKDKKKTKGMLELWNQDVGKYKSGDKIHLINGFARYSPEYELKISKGKYGSILRCN